MCCSALGEKRSQLYYLALNPTTFKMGMPQKKCTLLCHSGSSFVEVTECSLVEFQTCSIVGSLCLTIKTCLKTKTKLKQNKTKNMSREVLGLCDDVNTVI